MGNIPMMYRVSSMRLKADFSLETRDQMVLDHISKIPKEKDG